MFLYVPLGFGGAFIFFFVYQQSILITWRYARIIENIILVKRKWHLQASTRLMSTTTCFSIPFFHKMFQIQYWLYWELIRCLRAFRITAVKVFNFESTTSVQYRYVCLIELWIENWWQSIIIVEIIITNSIFYFFFKSQ